MVKKKIMQNLYYKTKVTFAFDLSIYHLMHFFRENLCIQKDFMKSCNLFKLISYSPEFVTQNVQLSSIFKLIRYRNKTIYIKKAE